MTPHRDPDRSPSSPDPERLLCIYLNDHLGGSAAGVALSRRMARAHRGTPSEAPLAALAKEIAEDRDTLREVMTALDVPVMTARSLAGRLAEKAGRMKLNGRIVSRSPLSDVLELEALRLGVEGKLLMWRCLQSIARTDGRLTDHRIDEAALDRMLFRAARQIGVLERLRLAAAERAFAPGAEESVRARQGAERTGRHHRRPFHRKAGWAS
ncbi:hypothetical protein AB0F11_34110 [Streptomyces sp. NPDC032472]|uniref:hypothetical protein n=1 Tax=Streptomyces sp. NPDC032472 TaxID=3155018 RepID=UPI0033E4005B